MYVTEPKYDVIILLANIGGQLGLFTGFSFLTGIEIFELFTDLCLTLARRLVKFYQLILSNRRQILPDGHTAGDI